VEEDRGVRVVWVKMVEAVMVRSPQIDGTCVF